MSSTGKKYFIELEAQFKKVIGEKVDKLNKINEKELEKLNFIGDEQNEVLNRMKNAFKNHKSSLIRAPNSNLAHLSFDIVSESLSLEVTQLEILSDVILSKGENMIETKLDDIEGPFNKALEKSGCVFIREIKQANPATIDYLTNILKSKKNNFFIVFVTCYKSSDFTDKEKQKREQFEKLFSRYKIPLLSMSDLEKIAKKMCSYYNCNDEKVKEILNFFNLYYAILNEEHLKVEVNPPNLKDLLQCIEARIKMNKTIYEIIMGIFGPKLEKSKKSFLLQRAGKIFAAEQLKPIPFEKPEGFPDCIWNDNLGNCLNSILFCLEKGKGIILAGNKGGGKSQFAQYVCQYLHSKDSEIKIIFCPCLGNVRTYKYEKGEENIFSELKKGNQLVILEDIEYISSFTLTHLKKSLEDFDGQNLQIICTCDVEHLKSIDFTLLNEMGTIILDDVKPKRVEKEKNREFIKFFIERYWDIKKHGEKSPNVMNEIIDKITYFVVEEKNSNIFVNSKEIALFCKNVMTFCGVFHKNSNITIDSIIKFTYLIITNRNPSDCSKSSKEIPIDRKIEEELYLLFFQKESLKDQILKDKEIKKIRPSLAKLLAIALAKLHIVVYGSDRFQKIKLVRIFAKLREGYYKEKEVSVIQCNPEFIDFQNPSKLSEILKFKQNSQIKEEDDIKGKDPEEMDEKYFKARVKDDSLITCFRKGKVLIGDNMDINKIYQETELAPLMIDNYDGEIRILEISPTKSIKKNDCYIFVGLFNFDVKDYKIEGEDVKDAYTHFSRRVFPWMRKSNYVQVGPELYKPIEILATLILAPPVLKFPEPLFYPKKEVLKAKPIINPGLDLFPQLSLSFEKNPENNKDWLPKEFILLLKEEFLQITEKKAVKFFINKIDPESFTIKIYIFPMLFEECKILNKETLEYNFEIIEEIIKNLKTKLADKLKLRHLSFLNNNFLKGCLDEKFKETARKININPDTPNDGNKYVRQVILKMEKFAAEEERKLIERLLISNPGKFTAEEKRKLIEILLISNPKRLTEEEKMKLIERLLISNPERLTEEEKMKLIERSLISNPERLTEEEKRKLFERLLISNPEKLTEEEERKLLERLIKDPNTIKKNKMYTEKFLNNFEQYKRDAIFEYQIFQLSMADEKKREELYENEKKTCENVVTKLLLHGTVLKIITKILLDNFKIGKDNYFGLGVYFSDQIDYIRYYWDKRHFNRIPELGENHSFVASEVYYNQEKRKRITDRKDYEVQIEEMPTKDEVEKKYKDKIVQKFGIHYAEVEGTRTEPIDKERVVHPGEYCNGKPTEDTYPLPDGLFIGREYVVTFREQILPMFGVTVKRIEYCVIWKISETSDQKDFEGKKNFVLNMTNYNIYLESNIKEALKLAWNKRFNKIILIASIDDNLIGKLFVDEVRRMLEFDAMVLFYEKNQNHLHWIKDYKNALYCDNDNYFEDYICNFTNEKELKNLKEKIEKRYQVKLQDFESPFEYPLFKSSGCYSELMLTEYNYIRSVPEYLCFENNKEEKKEKASP